MMNSSENLLEFKNIKVEFEENGKNYLALDEINIKIKKGEKLALIGESGCGKTVTALALMGLLSSHGVISQGEILFNGVDISHIPTEELNQYRGRDISMIFQEPMTSLNPLMKVGKQISENILEHNKNISKVKAKAKAIEILKEVGLADAEKIYNAYPHQLSGGMRQRIMIAMALVNNPKLIVADEPTTALDVTIQAQIMDLLKNLNEEKGTALLLISHDLGLVSHICEKACIMYAGRIVERGSTEDLLKNPLHPYTQGLLNSIPSIKDRGKPLNSIKGFVPSLEERNKSGCPFADRCDHAMEVCRQTMPAEKTINNIKVRCHLYDKEEA